VGARSARSDRRGRPLRLLTGGGAWCVGVLLTAAGAGLGVARVFDSGLSAVAVVGLVVFALGLALLGTGIVFVVRGIRGRWKIGAIPLVLFLTLFLIAPLSLAVYATNVPPTPLGVATPADRGLAYEDVSFTTSDGVTLDAWFIPSRNGSAIVLLHGAGSTRANTLDHAEVLAQSGYGVLALDSRGHGASGGRAMDFGWHGARDLEAAVTYLEERPEVTEGRIAAVGLSMGGEQAITAAASDERILVVVAEGVTRRVQADDVWLPRHLGGWIQRGMDWIMHGVAGILSGAEPPMGLRDAVVAIASRPVLLIAGESGDEVTAGRYYRDAAPQNVELWEIPEAPHIGGLAARPEEWRQRVIGFLDQALKTQ